MPEHLSPQDIRQLSELGISPPEAARQLELLLNPPPCIRLERPCRLGDGIRRLEAQEYPELEGLFEQARMRGRLSRLVPASGAASRMFKTLLPFLADDSEPGRRELQRRAERGGTSAADLLKLVDHLERFAFYSSLERAMQQRGVELRAARDREAYVEICKHLLTGAGMDCAALPKALIEFHHYPDGARSALEEQLVEAAGCGLDARGVCRTHFTIPAGWQDRFEAEVHRIQIRHRERLAVDFQVSFSSQDRSSDTLAVGLDNQPFRLDDGTLLLRPGGHGALITNLDTLREDIVFIKNIDNILPDRLKQTPIRWKKLLCGHLLALERCIHGWIDDLQNGDVPEALLDRGLAFVGEQLFIPAAPALRSAPARRKRQFLLERLRRPLRVCGVVPNRGEPGGGPFWVENAYGDLSLQIVEQSQIDPTSPEQQAIWAAATHFNPTDMVCSVRDRHGRPYDLQRYVDPRAVFIARKSHQGRELKTLERPGLWNGAMAHWNTVFVEIPDETFAPVKTVFDLLRPEHQ